MEDDWEVLHNSDESPIVNTKDFDEGIEQGLGEFSQGIIRSDYFSIHAHNNDQAQAGGYMTQQEDEEEKGSVDSDNPSWIDPESVIRYNPNKLSAEFWTDSSSDRWSDDHKTEFDAKSQLGNDEIQVSFDGAGDIRAETEGEEEGSGKVENVAIEAKSGVEEEKMSVVWWKLPLELLRYCVFRASPVWSLSVAAAVMGFVILGRRLYKMKRKSRSLQMKVTLDDKKVSQFMSRAARLNEAFSVVKRVPVIRPSLPAAGLTPWPTMMSLR
ncbi:hypothetical protein LguiA_011236 [Lonicera macranthoides]